MSQCTIEGCTGVLLAKGFCRKHYLRNWKYGSPYICKQASEYVPKGVLSPNFRHGYNQHPLYKSWWHMIDRCENPKNPAFKNYGGRGIKVCSRWHSIENFIEDMRERPPGKMLERLDNNGNYTPENCAWRTATDQSRNRRSVKLSVDLASAIRSMRGKMTRKKLAIHFNVSKATIDKVIDGEQWK